MEQTHSLTSFKYQTSIGQMQTPRRMIRILKQAIELAVSLLGFDAVPTVFWRASQPSTL